MQVTMLFGMMMVMACRCLCLFTALQLDSSLLVTSYYFLVDFICWHSAILSVNGWMTLGCLFATAKLLRKSAYVLHKRFNELLTLFFFVCYCRLSTTVHRLMLLNVPFPTLLL